MDLFNHLVMGAGLPTLGGVKGWVLDIVSQFIVIVVIGMAAKHFTNENGRNCGGLCCRKCCYMDYSSLVAVLRLG